VRARLLASEQGTRGGYRLGRNASLISVADVIQAVDGPVTVTACSTDDHNCDQYTKCSIRDPLWKIKNRIVEALSTVSVAEMAVEADAPAPVAAHTVTRMMFVPPVGE
jgi:Rrf2 family protein